MKILKDEGYIPNKRIRLIFGLDEESGSRCIKKYFAETYVKECSYLFYFCVWC